MKKFLFLFISLLMLLPSCTEVEHHEVSCTVTYNTYYPNGKVITKTGTYKLYGYYENYLDEPRIAYIWANKYGDHVCILGYGTIDESHNLIYEIVDYKLIKGNLHHITHELK